VPFGLFAIDFEIPFVAQLRSVLYLSLQKMNLGIPKINFDTFPVFSFAGFSTIKIQGALRTRVGICNEDKHVCETFHVFLLLEGK
jgi:hypothetical protein